MRIAAIIVVGAMLVALVVAASIALSPGTQSTTAGISEAELVDLQAVADQYGISLQTAIDRYAWNDDFAAAVAKIREAVPGAFTGAEIVDAGNAWVAFTGSAPAAATPIINNFTSSHSGVSVEVRANKGFTEVELEKAIKAAHFAVYDSPEVLNASTSFDFSTDTIETITRLASTASDTLLDELQSSAATKITTATRAGILDNISNSVTRFEGEVLSIKESNNEHLGGERLVIDLGNGDAEICTSGFGVKDADGNRGILTAGHCANTIVRDDGWTLAFKAHTDEDGEREHGDFQWHTAGPPGLKRRLLRGKRIDNRSK